MKRKEEEKDKWGGEECVPKIKKYVQVEGIRGNKIEWEEIIN